MSSLRINDMDMPKNCAECPILQTGSLEHYCPLAKESMWSIDAESGRHNNCPLSEIPTPHGDLVDRDDLIDEINRVTFAERYDYNVAYDIVTSAETVIEMEE